MAARHLVMLRILKAARFLCEVREGSIMSLCLHSAPLLACLSPFDVVRVSCPFRLPLPGTHLCLFPLLRDRPPHATVSDCSSNSGRCSPDATSQLGCLVVSEVTCSNGLQPSVMAADPDTRARTHRHASAHVNTRAGHK